MSRKRLVPAPPAPSTAPVDVTLPLKTVSEANSRGAWYGKAERTKKIRTSVPLAIAIRLRHAGLVVPARQHPSFPRRHPVRPACDLVVRITRTAPSAGLDTDNAVSAGKAVRDAIADTLGIDDKDPRVSWIYSQRRGAVKEYSVRIEVYRREENGHAAISIEHAAGGHPSLVLE